MRFGRGLQIRDWPVRLRHGAYTGVAQLAEQAALNRQVVGSNPTTRIWPRSQVVTTLAFQAGDVGFNSHRGHFAGVTQLVE